MKRSTVLVLVGIAAALVAAVWYSTRPQPLRVALVAADRGEVAATVSNTRAGTVDACARAKLAPILGGQIAALPVKEGDQVSANQVLLELWNEDIRAEVSLAERELSAARSRAEEACVAADVARREARRVSRLREQGLTSEGNADLADGEAKSKAAACRAMRSMIEVGKARVATVTAALERTILRAPFDGTVAEINGEIGEVVTPSPVGIPTLPAVDLIDSSCIFVTAPIDEVDAPEIRAGMRAKITLDAFPEREFAATVRRVAPYVMAIEKQARTVDVEAEFDQPSANLLPGYSADLEIILDVQQDTVRIPTQAVIDGSQVMILDGEGVLREREVQTGLRNWRYTEVRSGLRAGEQVVLSVDREGVVAGAEAVAE